jgi:DNA-binding CsgD family transcriptional regulator/PAS domain-containing protein
MDDLTIQSWVEMEDAGTIILPRDSELGDDSGMRQAVELFALAADVSWVKLELRAGRSDHPKTLTWGTPSGPSTSIQLTMTADVEATVHVSGNSVPDRHIVNVFASILQREVNRLWLLAESGLLRGALEATSSAVLLFGPAGSIVYANRRADRLLSRQTEEELTVDCRGEKNQPLFRLLCSQVERMLVGNTDETVHGSLVVSDGTKYTSEVVPLDAGSAGLGRVVLVVLREVGSPPYRQVEDFAGRHGLSPREREVLRLLVDGCDTAGMANRLGISPHTVRDHLKNLFRKTSSRSRSELLSSITSGAAVSR